MTNYILINIINLVLYNNNSEMTKETKEQVKEKNSKPEAIEKKKSNFWTWVIKKLKWRSEYIKIAILPPNNEKAWESFQDKDQNEMLESLEKKDSVELAAISIPTDMLEFEPSREWWERLKIKEWVLNEDHIGKYFNITVGDYKMKCREWQPGISWLAYTIMPGDRYNRNVHQIKIWFYEKWIEQKSTIKTYNYPM